MPEHRLAWTVDREATTWLERIRQDASRVFRRWQARRTASALQELNDEILKDIGIARDEIPAIALTATAKARSPTNHQSSKTREGRKGWQPYDHLANFSR